MKKRLRENENLKIDEIRVIKERLKTILKLETDVELSEILGINYSTFRTRLKNGTIPYGEIIEYCYENEININWVLYGKGLRNSKNEVVKLDDETLKLVDDLKRFVPPEFVKQIRDDVKRCKEIFENTFKNGGACAVAQV